jgi:hypothetical protein
MKEYRKKMPNYVVVLVNKVLEDAEEIAKNDESSDLANKFYRVSTYCKIKYHPNYTELIGLYRVKVNKIQDVKEDPESSDKKSEIVVNDSESALE